MNALDLCQQETVELATAHSKTSRPAWRFGDLACHRGMGVECDRWVITHLPSGTSFSSVGTFANVEDAAAALIEASRLRNSWDNISFEELPRLRDQIEVIFQKYNCELTRDYDINVGPVEFDAAMKARLNGYTGESA